MDRVVPKGYPKQVVSVLESRGASRPPEQVLVVGAGGLGCPAAVALAQAGVRRLTVVDPDRVELSNLHRQLLHRIPDLGRPKAESAARRLRTLFPTLEVEALVGRVEASNAESLFRRHALVIDGTDGVAGKFALSDAAVRAGVPLVYGGVVQRRGQAMLIQRGGPCLRCLFEQPPSPDGTPSCAQAGIFGPLAGAVGALQARLATEPVQGGPGTQWLWVVDGTRLQTRRALATQAPNCAGCGVREEAPR